MNNRILQEYVSTLINEIKWQDAYRPAFEEFRKKYLKFLKGGGANDLYVQFSTHANDTLDRNPNPNPDHSDPVAIYAYPIEYLLNAPSDVWYGRSAKFLRVLRDKSRKKIDLTSMTRSQAESLLFKMGFGGTSWLLDFAKKHYKHTGETAPGKAFLSVLQIDFTAEPQKGSGWDEKKMKYPVRSGLEQTQLLRKAGVDAIEDTSRTAKKAVINGREPEQIAFLHRGAFEVVEVFNLNMKYNHERDTITTDAPNEHIHRKFAQSIADVAMGDKLAEGPYSYSLNGYQAFWTKQGQRIMVKMEKDYSKDDGAGWNGQNKKHRKYKLADPYEVYVKMSTSRGEFEEKWDHNTALKDIVSEIQQWWAAAQDDPGFEPENKDAFLKKTELRSYYEYATRSRNWDLWEKASKELMRVANELGVQLTISEEEEEAANKAAMTAIKEVLTLSQWAKFSAKMSPAEYMKKHFDWTEWGQRVSAVVATDKNSAKIVKLIQHLYQRSDVDVGAIATTNVISALWSLTRAEPEPDDE